MIVTPRRVQGSRDDKTRQGTETYILPKNSRATCFLLVAETIRPIRVLKPRYFSKAFVRGPITGSRDDKTRQGTETPGLL